MSKIYSTNKRWPTTLLLGFLLVFFSCSQEPAPTPKGGSLGADLTEEQMIEILGDLHMSEGLSQIRPKAEKDSILQVHYDLIFKSHNITEEDFDRNLAIYMGNPIVADELYARVVEHLSILEAQNLAKKKTAQKDTLTRDSLIKK